MLQFPCRANENIGFKKRRRHCILNCWYISIQTSWPIIKEFQHNTHFVLFTSWHWGDMMSSYFREQCCIKWPCWNWNNSIYPLIHTSEMYCARLLSLDKTDELSRNLRSKDGYLRRYWSPWTQGFTKISATMHLQHSKTCDFVFFLANLRQLLVARVYETIKQNIAIRCSTIIN
jgi:hypothetical protein